MQRGIITVALLGGLFAGLGGCVDQNVDGAILVLRNIRASETCTVTASEDESGIPSGELDLQTPSDYVFTAQVKSRVTALEGQEDQRTIIVTGARVDVTFPNSALFSAAELAELTEQGLTKYRVLFSGVIAPNGGISDIGFSLVPGELVVRIRQQVMAQPSASRLVLVATFTMEGEMAGQPVTSQAFSYPITLDSGNVVSNLGGCDTVEKSFMPKPGYACNPYQDGQVECCTRPGTEPNTEELVCPAKGTLEEG